MTCLVGLVHRGRCYLGGDARMSTDLGEAFRAADPKVFRRGRYLVGTAGNSDYMSLLRYRVEYPEYLSTFPIDLSDAIRKAVRRAGLDPSPDGQGLIGIAGTLYAIDGDVIEQIAEPYASQGSGGSIALGALYATRGMGPRQRLLRALEAASAHRTDCAPPFTIIREGKEP